MIFISYFWGERSCEEEEKKNVMNRKKGTKGQTRELTFFLIFCSPSKRKPAPHVAVPD